MKNPHKLAARLRASATHLERKAESVAISGGYTPIMKQHAADISTEVRRIRAIADELKPPRPKKAKR